MAPTGHAVAQPPSSPPAVVAYAPPKDAPVADPFRPPPQPWLAGNRGIDYATTPGQAVHAIGTGTVAFAGPVAGRPVVAVVHPDGLRSSYVGVHEVRVAVGDRVVLGQVIARAGPHLHLGVRRGRTYLDPASLWAAATARGRVRLVPDRPDRWDPPDPPAGVARAWPDERAARWPWAS